MIWNFIKCRPASRLAVGLTVLVLLLAGRAGAAIITVNASGGADFTRIQDAINASINGDTIMVAAGIYNENVIVNKSVNLTGAGAEVTIVNASDPNSHVLYVDIQDGVNISGFTATGGSGGGHTVKSAGIYLSRTNDTNLSNNIVLNNYYGIFFYSTAKTNLSGNHIYSNIYGIFLIDSSRNIITNNTIDLNSYGIYALSSNNTIYNNFFNNSNNYDSSGTGVNIWNTTRQTAINIVGGLHIGGNFWSNASNTGFSQTCKSEVLEGICDSIYILSTRNVDNLPLAVPTGYVNGSVKYNNNGIADAVVTANTGASTTTNPSGFYSLQLPAGTYILTATSEPAYYPNSSAAITVEIGTTVVAQDIELLKKQTGNISGLVTNV